MRVVYNRIAKAGSTALITLIYALSKFNHFQVLEGHLNQYFPNKLTLSNTLKNLPNDTIYINHCNFMDGLPEDIVWINVMREPIERSGSSFYYSISEIRGLQKARQKLAERSRDKHCGCAYLEYDTCVIHAAAKNCTNILKISSAMEYFKQPGEQLTHDQAFHRIKNNYTFVGLSEEFELTLKSLEALLPRFFLGASDLYKSSNRMHAWATPSQNMLTNTTKVGCISHAARTILKEHNRDEIKLYERTKRLFWFKVSLLFPEYLQM